jgi:hypothetical protein
MFFVEKITSEEFVNLGPRITHVVHRFQFGHLCHIPSCQILNCSGKPVASSEWMKLCDAVGIVFIV